MQKLFKIYCSMRIFAKQSLNLRVDITQGRFFNPDFLLGREMTAKRVWVAVLSAEAANADPISAAQKKGSGLEERVPSIPVFEVGKTPRGARPATPTERTLQKIG